jgi:hypothetical protein
MKVSQGSLLLSTDSLRSTSCRKKETRRIFNVADVRLSVNVLLICRSPPCGCLINRHKSRYLGANAGDNMIKIFGFSEELDDVHKELFQNTLQGPERH